jgi:hypothetical protein
VHPRQQTEVGGDPPPAVVRPALGVGQQEVAEAVEDRATGGQLHAASDVRVVAHHQVDAGRARRAELPPLQLVGAHVALGAVVDREQAQVGIRRDQLPEHALAIRRRVEVHGAGSALGGPPVVAADRADADGAERDPHAPPLEGGRPRRGVAVCARAGVGERSLAAEPVELGEGVQQSPAAVVEGVVVGEREELETGLARRAERGGMRSEPDAGDLLAARQAGARGDHGLEVGEAEVTLEPIGDAGEELPPRSRPDLVAVRPETEIAGED